MVPFPTSLASKGTEADSEDREEWEPQVYSATGNVGGCDGVCVGRIFHPVVGLTGVGVGLGKTRWEAKVSNLPSPEKGRHCAREVLRPNSAYMHEQHESGSAFG